MASNTKYILQERKKNMKIYLPASPKTIYIGAPSEQWLRGKLVKILTNNQKYGI